MKWTAAGSKYIEYEVEASDARAAAKAYWEEHGRAPDTVEGGDKVIHVVGMCEGCQEAIFEGEKYGTDPDGDCPLCARCWSTGFVYIEAPTDYDLSDYPQPSLFLAGGITGCPDWQADMVEKLSGLDLTVLNPRRKDFPIHDPSAAEEQITWEYHALRAVRGILFWFPCETICPIVLFELGGALGRNQDLLIGVHPDYSRRQDVQIQTSLVAPGAKICNNLDDLAADVKAWAETLLCKLGLHSWQEGQEPRELPDFDA